MGEKVHSEGKYREHDTEKKNEQVNVFITLNVQLMKNEKKQPKLQDKKKPSDERKAYIDNT